MEEQEPWYLGQRAEALAMVILTRRSDLKIQNLGGTDSELDLMVELTRDGRETGRRFGIQLKSRIDPVPEESARLAEWVSPTTPALPITFPVCAFLFTMRDEGAYYYWIAEPGVEDRSIPKLRRPTSPDLMPLDNPGLERLVTQVDRWYEALTVALAA